MENYALENGFIIRGVFYNILGLDFISLILFSDLQYLKNLLKRLSTKDCVSLILFIVVIMITNIVSR